MFIFSFRASTLKLYALFGFCAVLLLLLVVFFPKTEADLDVSYPETMFEGVMTLKPSDFKNIETNEDRIAFLKLYGWEVQGEAVEIAQVTIPSSFDAVYTKYNQLQTAEGLDLSKYKSKTAKRYTYIVTNYDYDGTVYANLLIYKESVIAGDICSANADGFVHGLSKSNDFIS